MSFKGLLQGRRFDLRDGSSLHIAAFGSLREVLVHCHAGQSRSAAVVCKFLMKEEGNSLAEAMKRISTKRKVAIQAGLQEALDF